jgi:hypothetical protein
VRPAQEDHSLDHLPKYFEGLKDRYLGTLRPLEVRVTVDKNNRAAIRFINFPGGSFSQVIDTNTSVTVKSPAGHPIKVYIGGPPGPWTWTGDKYKKDANGNYRFVYTGTDAQAGKNVNAIILEVPLDFITRSPSDERIVNAWGESWFAKAARKVETIPDEPFWLEHLWSLIEAVELDEELKKYKLVDTDGQPFADAGLSEREARRKQFLARAPLHQAAGAPGLGVRAVDQRARVANVVRPRQRAGLVHKTYTLVAEAHG